MTNMDSFSLPPLPESLLSCILYLNKNDFNYENFIPKITTDIGLTEKILSVANSQYFAQGGPKLTNLKQALVRIGSTSLLKILTNEYYKTSFGSANYDFFTLRDLNLHSSYVSHLAVAIGKHLGVKDTNDLMIAGIFHDVGLLARYYCKRSEMEDIIKKCKENNLDFYNVEKEYLYSTHDTLGKIVAQKWNLSERICFIIENHHTPESKRVISGDSQLDKELDIIMFADKIAHRMKFGYSDYSRDTKINKFFLDRLGLTGDFVAKIANETLKNIMSFDF